MGYILALILTIGLIVLALFGGALIFALLIMWCWDLIMPSLFSLPEITYWQSVILYFIFRFLNLIFSGSKD